MSSNNKTNRKSAEKKVKQFLSMSNQSCRINRIDFIAMVYFEAKHQELFKRKSPNTKQQTNNLFNPFVEMSDQAHAFNKIFYDPLYGQEFKFIIEDIRTGRIQF